MPKPISLSVGSFSKGLNTATVPHLVPADEATDCTAVDVSQGAIKAAYGGVLLDSQPAGTSLALAYTADGGFSLSESQAWFCDGPDPTTSGARVTYFTSDLNRSKLVLADGRLFKMGLPAPVGAFACSGGTGGACQYVVTFYDPITNIESNPLIATGVASGPTGASLTGIPLFSTTGDPNRSTMRRRLYRTQPASTSGIAYFLTEIANNTATTFTDGASYTLNTLIPLNWMAGGSLASAQYPFDHAPAPSMTCVANEFYLPGGVQGAGGAGLLFGAVNNYLYWSAKDSPQYWPSTNGFRVNAPGINAILVHGSQVFLFCESDIFSVSGSDETSLTLARTNAPFGVKYEHAKTVCRTPYGIVFLSRQGLALFDGSNVSIISRGVMSAATFKAADTGPEAAGGFIEGFYFLSFGDGAAFRFDLRNLPDITVTRTEGFQACTVTAYPDQGLALYTVNGTIQLKRWRPSDDGFVASLKQPWSFRTGAIRSGPALHPITLNRLTLDASGTVTAALYKDNDATPFKTLTGSDRLSSEPMTNLYIKFSSSDGTGEVRGFRLDGQVFDGT